MTGEGKCNLNVNNYIELTSAARASKEDSVQFVTLLIKLQQTCI